MNEETIDIDDIKFSPASFVLHNQDIILCEVAEVNDDFFALKYPVRVRQLPDLQSGLSRFNPFSDDVIVAIHKDLMMAHGELNDRAYEFYRNAVKSVYSDIPSPSENLSLKETLEPELETVRTKVVLH